MAKNIDPRHIPEKIRLMCIVFLLFIITGYGASSLKADDQLSLYHFGVPPYQKGQTIDEIRGLYKPMLVWLGERLGCKFDFIGAESYEEMIDMVAQGKVHLASLGPVPFLEAKEKNPKIELLLTELSWNRDKTERIDSYHSYILTLKDRTDLNGLGDLKGKSFAFVNRHSTSGYQYPNAILRKQGIIPEEYFGRVFFLGSHPRVTDAIAAGSIDAGSTYRFNWEQATKKHGDIFKAVFTSPPIPMPAIAAHPSFPKELQEKVIKELPAIDPELLKGIPCDGYTVRPESFYDGIRVILEQEKME